MHCRLALFGFLMVVALPQGAAAQGEMDLADGLRLFDELDYDAAATKLTVARRSEDLGPHDRARASLYLSIILLAQGRDAAAHDSLREALRLERSLALPDDSSPKLRALFDEVKASLSRPQGLRLTLVPPTPDAAQRRVTVHVEGDGARAVASIAVSVRRRAAPSWQRLATVFDRSTGAFAATLPDWGPNTDVECFLEARGRDGTLLADGVAAAIPGTAASSPHTSRDVTASRDEPLYARWWVWAGAGAVVVTTVLVAVLVATRDQDTCKAPSGSGCVHLVFR